MNRVIDDEADEAEKMKKKWKILIRKKKSMYQMMLQMKKGKQGTMGKDDGAEPEEEEDDDADGVDELRRSGFIVDDLEEEEEDEEDMGGGRNKKKKKKKKRHRVSGQLDEEDYDLIEEQTGKRIARPVKERRRIKKAREEFGRKDEASGDINLNDMIHDIFDEDESDQADNDADDDRQVDQFDEMADFIDDTGAIKSSRDRRRVTSVQEPVMERRGLDVTDVDPEALEDAEELFGEGFDLQDFEDDISLSSERDAIEEDTQNEDGEELVSSRAIKRLSRKVEPAVLKDYFYTLGDDEIRSLDIPERLQGRYKSLKKLGEVEANLEEIEAEWIVNTYFADRSPFSYAKDILGAGMVDEVFEYNGIQRSISVNRNVDEQIRWFRDETEQSTLRKCVQDVLTYMHKSALEIPCIAERYKEDCGSLLAMTKSEMQDSASGRVPICRRWDILWHIYDSEEKWINLQLKKADSRELIESMQKQLQAEGAQEEQVSLFMDAGLLLDSAASLEELNDIKAFIRIHSTLKKESGEDSKSVSKYKKAASIEIHQYKMYTDLFKKNLTQYMGLKPQEVGENLYLGYRKNNPRDHKMKPQELAETLVDNEQQGDLSFVIYKASANLAGYQIFVEPRFRRWAREKYHQYATVTTKPSRAGLSALDPFHMCGDVKSLKDKPISQFQGNYQFAKILHANQENLLFFKIRIDETDRRRILEELYESFQTGRVNEVAREWDNFRGEVLDSALQKIEPRLFKEIENKLKDDAQEILRREFADVLWTRFSKAPFVMQYETRDGDFENVEGLRVLSCVIGPGDPPTTVTILDEGGELIDFLFLGGLNGMSFRFNRYKETVKKKDLDRLEDFIMKYRPHVVCLGASNLSCPKLMEDIAEVVARTIERDPFVLDEGISDIPVVFTDETAASVWSQSQEARLEFPEHSPEVKRCVALGRSLLEPLAVLSSLHNSRKEILSINIHELEQMIDKESRMAIYERFLVTVVNQCGIQLNEAVHHRWLSALMSFVAGLGPRKAAALKSEILRHGGYVSQRIHLLKGDGDGTPQIMKKNVYENASTSLRITKKSSDETWDPYDETSIYGPRLGLAKELCNLALESSGHPGQKSALETLRKDKRAIEALNSIETTELKTEIRAETKWSSLAFSDILNELTYGYARCRLRWMAPAAEQLFYLLSGESEWTLRRGRLVNVKVKRVHERLPMELKRSFENQQVAQCALDSGLISFIPLQLLSSSKDIIDMNDRLQVGQTITGRIEEVDYEKFFVLLTTRSNDLADENKYEQEYFTSRDKYYIPLTKLEKKDILQGSTLDTQAIVQHRRKVKSFQDRPIDHIMFRNLSPSDAEKFLQGNSRSFVFRPSTKGNSNLSLTMKVYENTNLGEEQLDEEPSDSIGNRRCVFWHHNIEELGKVSNKKRNNANHLKLGDRLKIGKDEYEDLDEIIHSYVEPISIFIQKMITYRKFRYGEKHVVDQYLKAERNSNPGMTPYAFSVNFEIPGSFTLTYVPSTQNETPVHLKVQVRQDGYLFDSKIFKNLEKLTAYFKKNVEKIHNNKLSNDYRAPLEDQHRQIPFMDTRMDPRMSVRGGNQILQRV